MAVTTGSKKRRVPWPVEFYRSAVGKKWVMAVTGIIWMGYLLAHMIGNLKIYIGFLADFDAYEIDLYGVALRELLFPIFPSHVVLWVLRLGLIVALVFHVHAAYSLTVMNRRARQIGYQGPREYLVANYASRTMRWSGVLVLVFIFWHLADFTWGIAPFAPDSWEHGAVYANFIATFSRVPVSILYIVANLALGLHLYHGVWSLFQSLGINNPRFNPWRRYFAMAFTAIIVIPNVSFPIAVLSGIVS
ncbi:MAG TPA: succinate dehydrogenase cytochrome b subunit [Acidimicrobiia bacterium]|nr:succinate dehydrogenase cytochrome b subunit [Acidimicrobiia bacterium]